MKRSTLRQFWVLVHRYAGLYMAFFLIVAGATGSVLAFTPELWAWLNPQFKVAPQSGPMLDGLALHRIATAAVAPRGRIDWVSLHGEREDAYAAWVTPRIDAATGRPYTLPFNILLLNPYSGAEIARIDFSEDLWPITRQNLISLILALHFRLAIPGSVGTWAFGIAALLWTVDCFVGAYLTFPARRRSSATTDRAAGTRPAKSWWARWYPAWCVKRSRSPARVNFDLHRAGGLWFWLMLLVLAWSSVGLNLNREVYTPVMKALFGMPEFEPLTVSEGRPPLTKEPDWLVARDIGRKLMAERSEALGFAVVHEESLQYDPDKSIFKYAVRSDRDVNDVGGATMVTFDAANGNALAWWIPSGQNAGATLHSWIFALHQAFVWGLPYKIFLCLVGIVVVTLSVTGVYIWWKKHQGRLLPARRRMERATAGPHRSE